MGRVTALCRKQSLKPSSSFNPLKLASEKIQDFKNPLNINALKFFSSETSENNLNIPDIGLVHQVEKEIVPLWARCKQCGGTFEFNAFQGMKCSRCEVYVCKFSKKNIKVIQLFFQ